MVAWSGGRFHGHGTLGQKRTSRSGAIMSAFDPKRTSAHHKPAIAQFA